MKAKYLIAELADTLEEAAAFLASTGNVHGQIDGKPVDAKAIRAKIKRRLRTAYKACEYAEQTVKRRTL